MNEINATTKFFKNSTIDGGMVITLSSVVPANINKNSIKYRRLLQQQPVPSIISTAACLHNLQVRDLLAYQLDSDKKQTP